MATKPQRAGICIKTVDVISHGDGGVPKQPTGIVSGSFTPTFRQTINTMMDLASVAAMEEKYAIREEGLF